ncbi:cAMP-binding protein [Desulfitobacterium dichloroeliminans LMG P-21439]|uniref:cAMP-binding protein n=1 Tax=Desulfitobacterium dichloroeliminans (strain LMG P-21439 / DCA1) TaxID=871963 RepID=L0F6E4_DESDL|nr:Crp/Fnr family transcriptional regulator [Desulfitobacterium dichloroeliminans]AGA68762.1 cAMP-binding protein [Desulfitobacterium dichloroeliminans LMG P-21439]
MGDKRSAIIEELIETFCFAGDLSYKQLENLMDHSNYQEAPAGTIVAEKGSFCHGLALVLSGDLRVAMNSEDGREITMYHIGKGRICPLSAACVLGDFKGNTVTVTAEVDTRVIWVTRRFFEQSFTECEPFYRFVMSDLSNRLFEATLMVDGLAFISVRKRLAQLLLSNSNDGRCPVYITHEGIARELGTAREVISRELKGFERVGILTLSRGRLDIKNSQELEKIIQQ